MEYLKTEIGMMVKNMRGIYQIIEIMQILLEYN